MNTDSELTLTEIASRINSHLKRMESDPAINVRKGQGHQQIPLFWDAGACRAGTRVSVQYVSFQGFSNLTRTQALEYLAWLDAGNTGKHWKSQGGSK